MPTMAHTQDPQTHSRLLQLTPELRNLIYDYVFTAAAPPTPIMLPSHPAQHGTVINFVHNTSLKRLLSPPPPSILSLLQTCRQIHDEASAIFYHINHLYMHCFGLQKFSVTANLARLCLIRELTVVVDVGEAITAVLKKLRRATGLRVLHFRFKPPAYVLYHDTLKSATTERYHLKNAMAALQQVEEVSLCPFRFSDFNPQQMVILSEQEAMLKQIVADRVACSGGRSRGGQ